MGMTKKAAYYALLDLGYSRAHALQLAKRCYPFVTYPARFMYDVGHFTYLVDTDAKNVDVLDRNTNEANIGVVYDDFKKVVAAHERGEFCA